VSRLLAALLARVLPVRGRHSRLPVPDDDTPVFLAAVQEDDEGVSPADEKTRLDLSRVRPYVDRRDPPEMIP